MESASKVIVITGASSGIGAATARLLGTAGHHLMLAARRGDALSDVARTLGTSTSEERLDLPGIDERRADLLPTGAVVLTAALAAFGANEAIHSEWGLREGVALRALRAPIPTDPAAL